MTTYTVEWTIELEATCPEDAARQALALHRDPTSTCTCFDVYSDDPHEGDGYHHHKVDFTESGEPEMAILPRLAPMTFSLAGLFVA